MHDLSGEHSEDLAVRWIRAEPVIRAFVASAVWDVHHAEDVLQNVASVASKKFESFDGSRPFVPWCLGIARLKVIEYFRANSRDKMVLSEGALMALETAAQELAEDYLVARRVALQQCIRKLKGRQRKVIEMRYLLEIPLETIAKRMTTTSSSIAVTLHRARASLRECVLRTVTAEGVSK